MRAFSLIVSWVVLLVGVAEDWQQQFERGLELQRMGRYAEADQLLQLATDQARRVSGSSQQYALSLSALATLQSEMGNADSADKLLDECIRRLEMLHGRGAAVLAAPLHNRAALHIDAARYDAAESAALRGLDIVLYHFGPNDGRLVPLLRDLGRVQSWRRSYKNAEAYYREAVRIAELTNNIELPVVLNDLAVLCRQTRRVPEAGALLETALRSAEKQNGSNHPELVWPLTNLGSWYCLIGRCDEGELLLQRASALAERVWGPQHLKVCEVLTVYAAALRAGGRGIDANRVERRAVAIQKAAGFRPPRRATVTLDELKNRR